jgi:secretion/DNA translocation related TadE-like protein
MTPRAPQGGSDRLHHASGGVHSASRGLHRLARRRAERGSASLIGLAMCGFVMVATLVTADVGALVAARARAQTAADLAALAAVTPHPGASLEPTGGVPGDLGSPAGRAGAVAASNGAELVSCSCGPLETTISVRVPVRLIPPGTTVQVRAHARAVLPLGLAPPPGGGARLRGGRGRSAPDQQDRCVTGPPC